MAALLPKDEFTSPVPTKNNRRKRVSGSDAVLTPSSEGSSLDSPASGRALVNIPPSPFMEKLGCGTGVAVYLFQRGSSTDGLGLSPWAVKRTRARTTCGKETSDNFVDKRLAMEARILKELKHDNIVGFRAFGQSVDGRLCLSMEKEEQSLFDLIEMRDEKGLGPFPASQVYHVALGIARALNYLHKEKHLLHGDLKSGNVLIGDNFKSVKLCDFGVALKLREDMTGLQNSNDLYMCSEPWSAPEGLNEDDEPITDKADIFSYGLVIWEMMSLTVPHVNSNDLYMCSEPWSAPEGLNEDDEPITDKADIFSYGLVIWEMMSLTVPHVDLLVDSMCEDDQSCDESFLEDRYQLALGTRPPPPNFHLGLEYEPFMSLFWTCTEELPPKRPSASFIIEALESMSTPSDQGDKENLPMMDFNQ